MAKPPAPIPPRGNEVPSLLITVDEAIVSCAKIVPSIESQCRQAVIAQMNGKVAPHCIVGPLAGAVT